MFREPRAPKLCPKSVILVTNGVAMARHGPILGEIEATPSGELLKHLPGPPGPVFGLKITNKVENLGKSQIPVFSRLRELVRTHVIPAPGACGMGGPTRGSCHHFAGSGGSRGSGNEFQIVRKPNVFTVKTSPDPP